MNRRRSIAALLVVALVFPLMIVAPVQGTPATDAPDWVPADEDGVGQAAASPGALAVSQSAGGGIIYCGASGTMHWTTTSDQLEVIRECTLRIPRDGDVFIAADAWLLGDRYEAEFRLAVEGPSNYYLGRRTVDVYPVPPDGTSKSVALFDHLDLYPGMWTFRFMGKRTEYSNPVEVWDPTLSVIFIPRTDTEILSCGDLGGSSYMRTTSSSFSSIRVCALDLPSPGWVYLSANAWLARFDEPYEARYRIGIDDTTDGEPDTDRYVDVYDDQGDGTDKSVAVSILKPIAAGTHDFHFLHSRYEGPGTVETIYPSLGAIYIPAGSTEILHCESSGVTWLWASDAWGVIGQCSLTLPTPRWVFLSTNAWLWGSGEYTAHFRIGIDDMGGDVEHNRYVDLYEETDETVALSVLKWVRAGTHDFYFLGRRQSGDATVWAIDPTLSVMALPNRRVFLPLLLR